MIGVHHLLERPGLAHHEVVREHHGKGFVSHQMLGAQHRVAEAQGLLLPRERHGARIGEAFQQAVQLLGLLPRGQERFQLIGVIEMIFDHMLAPAGHEDELLDARLACLLHPVLDHGLVDNRQHLLWNCLGGGQESCAHPGDGKDGFTNWWCRHRATDDS